MLRLEQLCLTRAVIHIMCRVKHQRDHLTGSISNTKTLGWKPRTPRFDLFAALCGTVEGGEHLFLHVLLQTGRSPGDVTVVQHRLVNLIRSFFLKVCAVSGMPVDLAN